MSGRVASGKSGWKPIAVWLLSASITLQLYALALPEFLRVGLHEESQNSEWTSPIWVIRESLQNLSIGFSGLAVVGVGFTLVLVGWFSLFQQSRRAALNMVLPPAAAGSLMLVLGHNLFPRFFFFSMAFGILIVVQGAVRLPKILGRFTGQLNWNADWLERVGTVLASAMILVSAVMVPRNYAMPKQDFAGARSFVEQQAGSNDHIVAVGLAGDMYSKYYAPTWQSTDSVANVEQLQTEYRRVWLVYTLAPQIKAFHPELWKKISQDFETVMTFPGTLNGGDVFVCRSRVLDRE